MLAGDKRLNAERRALFGHKVNIFFEYIFTAETWHLSWSVILLLLHMGWFLSLNRYTLFSSLLTLASYLYTGIMRVHLRVDKRGLLRNILNSAFMHLIRDYLILSDPYMCWINVSAIRVEEWCVLLFIYYLWRGSQT